MNSNDRKKKGSAGLNLLLFFATLILCLILIETGFRIFWQNPFRHALANSVVRLGVQNPWRDQIIEREIISAELEPVRFRTGARSYILPSFQYENPDYVIAFLGASTTECKAVAEDLRFPAYTGKLLAEKGIEVNTLNAGKSAAASHDAINVLLNHVLLEQPDAAFFMFACNDASLLQRDPHYRSRMGIPVNSQCLSRWIFQMISSHCWAAAYFRLNSVSHIPWKADDYGSADAADAKTYEQRVRLFIEICRVFEIEPVLMTQPAANYINVLTPKWFNLGILRKLNQSVRDIGAAEGVTVIDLMAYVEKELLVGNEIEAVLYDGLHYTDYGSVKIAEKIASTLENEILPRIGPSQKKRNNLKMPEKFHLKKRR